MERVFKTSWSSYECKESDIVREMVNSSYDYDGGVLEDLRAAQNKLVEIVSELFLRLPEEDRDQIINIVSHFKQVEF